VQIVQSHLIKGQSPTNGPVTVQLVAYGIARLREDHKGKIVEPLAFLSLTKWLQTQGRLDLQANLRIPLDNELACGSGFEEVGVLYLLRALRYPVPFTTVFNFQCTPSWADEKAHIVARLNGVDVAIDVLGEKPENPGLGVVHYASSIEEIIDWIEQLDTASEILIPSHLFGPDVMARCHSSSSNRNFLLMGQFTAGDQSSLDAGTVAEALASLHPNHWFKEVVCHLVSLFSSAH
jgi:hypothetical protein